MTSFPLGALAHSVLGVGAGPGAAHGSSTPSSTPTQGSWPASPPGSAHCGFLGGVVLFSAPSLPRGVNVAYDVMALVLLGVKCKGRCAGLVPVLVTQKALAQQDYAVFPCPTEGNRSRWDVNLDLFASKDLGTCFPR